MLFHQILNWEWLTNAHFMVAPISHPLQFPLQLKNRVKKCLLELIFREFVLHRIPNWENLEKIFSNRARTSSRSKFHPSSIETLGSYAFFRSHVRPVTFAANSRLQTISQGLFKSCENITSIEIPSSVKIIEGEAFANTNLQFVTFAPNSKLRKIGEGAFTSCPKFLSIEFPPSMKKFNASAFDKHTIVRFFEPDSHTDKKMKMKR